MRSYAMTFEDKNVLTDLAHRCGEALQRQGLQLTTAESCTGGGIAEAITRIAGSSAWFGQGWVTYSNAAKVSQLGVPTTLLDTQGAVSEAVVIAMAEGARLRADADWAIAVSGVAGPGGGSPEKPVGTVWLAWASRQATYAECQHFSGDRSAIREQTVALALTELFKRLCGSEVADPMP